MRKLSFALLSLSLLGCLAGCGAVKENQNATTQASTEAVSSEEASEETTEEEKVTFKNVVKDMYATTTINAYAEPKHKLSVLLSFTVGNPIHITGESKEWYRVEVENDNEIVVCYIVRHEDCLSADNPTQVTQSSVSSGGANVNVSDDATTESNQKKKNKKKEESESSTETGSASANFTQDEPNVNDDPLTPKEPEVDIFDVNNQ